MSELEKFRIEKDEFFLSGDHSPLTTEQKAEFTALNYYPENPSLKMELSIERNNNPIKIILQTSTGDIREYFQIGHINFTIGDTDCVLQVYEDDYGFFLPFIDKTAPGETYGAGRYLEPQEIRADVLYVDFNLAYNPYCAYNNHWSCPLPPDENRLNVRIEAGEKKFHE